jgi:hypothetical protein
MKLNKKYDQEIPVDIVAGIAKELFGDNVKVILGGFHVAGEKRCRLLCLDNPYITDISL